MGAASAINVQQRLLRAQAHNLALQAQKRNSAGMVYQKVDPQAVQMQNVLSDQQQQGQGHGQEHHPPSAAQVRGAQSPRRQNTAPQSARKQENMSAPEDGAEAKAKAKAKAKKEKARKDKPVNPLKSSEHVQRIMVTVAKCMAESVESNDKVLNERTIMANKKKADETAERRKRKEAKDLIQGLLRNKKAYKMPRWRHMVKGNRTPTPDVLMKGISLFRMAGRLVLYMIAKPWLAVKKKREETKAKQMTMLNKTIMMYTDSTNDWLGRLVKVPLASIVRSPSLNLASSREHVMMQLKICCQTFTSLIASSGKPPEFLQDFFALLVLDGNYYPDGFLFDYEKELMAFDQFGAVHMMQPHLKHRDGDNASNGGGVTARAAARAKPANVPALDLGDATAVAAASAAAGQTMNRRINEEALEQIDPVLIINRKHIHIRRVRAIVLHYIILNGLIAHVIISPWHTNLCAKPPVASSEGRASLMNLRVLATVLYMACRAIEPGIPPVEVAKTQKEITPAAVEQEGGEAPSMPNTEPFSLMTCLNSVFGGIETDLGVNQSTQKVLEMMIHKREKYVTMETLHGLLLPESHFKSSHTAYVQTYVQELGKQINKWVTGVILCSLERKLDDALISTRTGRDNVTARTARVALMKEEVDDEMMAKIAGGALRTVRVSTALSTRRTGRVMNENLVTVQSGGVGQGGDGGGESDSSDDDKSDASTVDEPVPTSRLSARFAPGS